jgi:thymidylate kinase
VLRKECSVVITRGRSSAVRQRNFFRIYTGDNMSDTKLILITGMSGAGKSTTAQSLACQYQLNHIRYRWLHEEIRDHPIRAGEFSIGSLCSDQDLESNMQDMFQRWERLIGRILTSGRVYIMEGVLYDNILRYFYESHSSLETITWYYDELMKRLAPTQPVVVHLCRADVRATLETMYQLRGQWWKNLILKMDKNQYCRDHGLAGEDGVYAMWQAYQETAQEMFRRWSGKKIEIDTTAGEWASYMECLTQFLGIDCQPLAQPAVAEPGKYCGCYEILLEGQLHTLDIKFDGASLYCQAFWEYMKLLPLGGNRFVMSSFPVKLTFLENPTGSVEAVRVRGPYDWEIMGKTLPKVLPAEGR